METDLSLNLNLKDTELTLGLPGTHSTDSSNESESPPTTTTASPTTTTTTARPQKRPAPPTSAGSDPPSQPKAQVVGWPPIRSYRKNNLQPNHQVNKKKEETSTVESNTNTNTNLEESAAVQNYVKVSMDGAPFLRKIDLNGYKGGYPDLLKGLETMFKFTVGQYSEREGYKGSEFVPTYEDKDGDWMLVGDVPWEMFLSTCKRLRIMKGSEAKGLGCV